MLFLNCFNINIKEIKEEKGFSPLIANKNSTLGQLYSQIILTFSSFSCSFQKRITALSFKIFIKMIQPFFFFFFNLGIHSVLLFPSPACWSQRMKEPSKPLRKTWSSTLILLKKLKSKDLKFSNVTEPRGRIKFIFTHVLQTLSTM